MAGSEIGLEKITRALEGDKKEKVVEIKVDTRIHKSAGKQLSEPTKGGNIFFK